MIHVPAREGRAVGIEAGRRFRVIDPQGSQVADVFAFSVADVSEYASAEHTRVHVNRLFPRVGEHFVTNRRRPILRYERDDSPGVHDMLCAACDPTRYAGLGLEGWHASCEENLERALSELGYDRIEVPQSINLFMNIPLGADGALGWEPAPTRAGDSVTFRAELDCYLVVSACPQDVVPINAGNPTPIDIELLD
ncbi:MAG: urea carboxylase-associated family protein [Actinomycetota bacterium]|nr:urea carboxylase-associated family protein [Actinomycetota bacterium]